MSCFCVPNISLQAKKSSWWSLSQVFTFLFQETLEHLEECSSNAISQSDLNIPTTCAPVCPPATSRTVQPIWSTPRRYPRSPSPLAHPLTQTYPSPSLHPVLPPAHSPCSSPCNFSPIRNIHPQAGIPPTHLAVEADCLDTGDQIHSPSQQWQLHAWGLGDFDALGLVHLN